MRRREFLRKGGRAALSVSLLRLSASALENPWATQISELESLIPGLMKDPAVPGLSIAVIHDAKLIWRRGFGVRNSASREPVDDNTVFEAASISKTVFAYAVLKLCEKGVIGLDTPLTRYAPRPFLEGDPRLDLITARHVLSHTSGFQNWRSDERPLKIHFTPGERYFYSGEGYSYLQSVVTHLTGPPIDAYMRANLFRPFGMSSSGYVWNDRFENQKARAHDPDGKPFEKPRSTETTAARYAAAGDLLTTPTDYARFLIEVIHPKAKDEFRMGAESLREMVRPHVKVDDSRSWALGWQIRHTGNGDLIQHGGNNKGFHAFAAASIERKSGFIVMTNGENGWKLITNPAFAEVMTRFLVG